MMTTLQRRSRRISQTMEQMSCTYICSMIPCGLISCSKASPKASNSSAGSVMSNGTFGRSVSLFIRGILFSNEFTQGRCADQLGRSHRTSPHRCERIIAHIVDTSYVVAVPGAAEMDGLRGRFGGQTALVRP